MTASNPLEKARTVLEIHAGFIPLVDCGPLAIAKELGFAAENGIDLVLHKDVSWANIRDKVEAGLLDCAIMLAPMPIAATLGLGGRAAIPMIAAMSTSLSGNAITVSPGLYDEKLNDDRASAEAGGMAASASIARVVKHRRDSGKEPLTVGIVYPFSVKEVVKFSSDCTNFPWVSHATWLLTQMIRWGQVRAPFDIAEVARRVYRPDLYRSALAGIGADIPDVDLKTEGGGQFFGADSFDPTDPIGYIEGLPMLNKSIDLKLFGSANS
jgi:ABC-type nitrate/sulfonate/bicarbonate transport system substrate-binding protein